jgi:hypothetical protein
MSNPGPTHQPYGQDPYGQQPGGQPSPYGQQPAGDRRPGTVTAAAWITIVFSAITAALFGFTEIGTFREVGRKFGEWWDVTWLERMV